MGDDGSEGNEKILSTGLGTSGSRARFSWLWLVIFAGGLALVTGLGSLFFYDNAGRSLACWMLLICGSLTLFGGWKCRDLLGARGRLGVSGEGELSDDDRERDGLLDLRKQAEADLARLGIRQEEFEKRLRLYGEWMEFPMFEESLGWQDSTANESDKLKDSSEVVLSEEEVREASEKDRALAKLVEARAEELVAKFREDGFSSSGGGRMEGENMGGMEAVLGGNFQPRLLLDEVMRFLEDAAKIYRPDSNSPLLETSVERVLRAVNRISLQLLIHLEQVPFNLKDYSLANAYDHARKAGRLHGYYRAVSPYLPVASYTWQLGRLVLGANPVAAGTWYLGTEVLRRGGTKVTKKFLEHHVLRVLAETMRILGDEAAMLFDPEVRYRDGSWAYGVELVELIHRFPLSRTVLQEAMNEVGRLPLRCSYDRVFLYRCLAAHVSPKPDRVVKAEGLSLSERRSIARQLEDFFEKYVHGRREDLVKEWRVSVEARLGVKLKVSSGVDGTGSGREMKSEEAKVEGALRSVASYLRVIRVMEPNGELLESLGRTGLARRYVNLVGGDRGEKDMREIGSDVSEFFEYPDLEPGDEVLDLWQKDLLEVERMSGVVSSTSYESLRGAMEYFRMPVRPFEREMEQMSQVVLGANLDEEWRGLLGRSGQLPRELLFVLPNLLARSEVVKFFYEAEPVRLKDGESGGELMVPGARFWLIGTQRRLFLLAVEKERGSGAMASDVSLVWSVEKGGEAWLERRGTGIGKSSQGMIRGGLWHVPEGQAPDGVVLKGSKLAGLVRFEKFFAPLARWAGVVGMGG